ncbi:metal ABC transporter solute-binding protein, Zn/Mn family [Microcystis aeruginosa]|uniref:Periplasmic solute binding protein n=1 Tax=Microcystis aeruginosa NIES-3787 TaxID=2517782 RepID=A0A6H9GD04_MICAE|nr:zinc ABC transporter substrate-binding protein [Microcystis aeruginosa]GCL47829.1 periplasmic solute binding protein [Microcystis aeruginosa NIES-3787]
MKKLILSCLFLGLVACNPSVNTTDNQKPKVISTSTIIADLTARVGGEEIDHQDILKPGDDPHVYEPVPADSVALEKADLILYNGYNLEPGLIKMIDSTAVKAKKVAVGEAIKPLQLAKEGQKVPDPHVWGSAKNGIIMVEKIRDQLIELSPEDKDIFTANAAQLIAELENLDRWITAAIKTIPASQRQLVTTHDAFQYYAHAYGLKVAGTLIGISTEEQPSAQTVKNLADAIKNLQVAAIFAETTINPALITTVAEEAGVKLAPQQLYSDSIGAVGTRGDSYVKMLKENTRSIVESLGGKVPQEGQ